MQNIQIAAGSRTRIIQRQFSSLVTTYTFTVVPMDPDTSLAGMVDVKGSSWVFPKAIERMPLQPRHTVTAGMWDTFFAVYIIPEVDVVVSLPSTSFGGLIWIVGLVVGIMAIAIALVFLA